MTLKPGRLPALHVVGDSIPQAWWRAIHDVWNFGAKMPTQYDRHNDAGELIDQPGRDARVTIEIIDPFAQPRYSPISHCQRGVYIAEIMGVKDNYIVPMPILVKQCITKDVLTDHEKNLSQHWPYSYHQRLFNHPETDGRTVNQINLAIDRVVKTPFTRRAVSTTAVPNLDPFMDEDIPCLRELQLRCLEDGQGGLVLNATTTWRSRDLYKAWGDNVIAITFLLARIADVISAKCHCPVRVGSYAEFCMSLHIYGQDLAHVNGDKAKGLTGFFDTFYSDEAFVNASSTSEEMAPLIISELEDLKLLRQIQQWQLGESQLTVIDVLIDGIESGRYIC